MHDSIDPMNAHAHACGDRLRKLPPEVSPPYNWQEFQRRSEQRLRAGAAAPVGGHRLDWRYMAAAAALLLIVCGTAVWGRLVRGAYDGEGVSGVSALQSAALQKRPEIRPAASGFESVAALRSRAIDSWLATLPREPVVVHVGTRAAVAQLEDRIAQVDDLLTSVRVDGMRPDSLAALQQERVRLVGSLAQVRYAEVVAASSP